MNNFIGEIIIESLNNPSVLDSISEYIIKERIESRPSETEKIWHIRRYLLPRPIVVKILPMLETSIKHGWYIHFFSKNENELIIIMKNKSFIIHKVKDNSWEKMIEYGETIGCGRRWTENIPIEFPD